MTSELTIALAVLFGGSLFVAGVSRVAPLTSWETPREIKESPELSGFGSDGGYGHCRAQLPGVDCACFSQKASQILAETNERALGWSYADRWDLARTQATAACS
ncbi:hypothetical protein [Tropicibacter oceani]|uniref:Secreted protein n=1 Tax=Tropicibacter oceani TaxID=3058420 RepID=A0ABY8QME2_9RHOB|nr:hypothetical protein [Tropicibacter oceani]WGW05739.1 hypothetical protein QF118_09390 [Tropicibacter oceani]